ncbi:hypothetical protein NBRC116584_20640 [Hydrogenophaga sp. 5NK40-0174]
MGWDAGAPDKKAVVRAQLRLPSRAHGVHVEQDGSILVAARRPGDWLLRWNPSRADDTAQWFWIDDDHRFTGHVLGSDDGNIWTTETRLEDARGLVSRRDPHTFERLQSWPTGGFDPHMMLRLPVALGALPAGTLLVANGGIPTLAETGRLKRDLDRMDASLAAFHGSTGEALGRWTLGDPRLSIRHLSFDSQSQQVGTGLQAQHDADSLRLAAPVLALFDGWSLRTATGQPGLDGYGGDLCARPGGGFLVGCPKSNQLAAFDAEGRWLEQWPMASACAVDQRDGRWWAGGENAVFHGVDASSGLSRRVSDQSGSATSVRLDNHWRLWSTA